MVIMIEWFDKEEIARKEKAVCGFYGEAFCGKSARIVRPSEERRFKVTGVMEIETGDTRGTIFVATVEEVKGEAG